MDVQTEYKKKSIRSYVIRSGRITDGQKIAFDQYWPAFGLSLYQGEINPEQLFNRQAALVVEVGFGMGDSLIKMVTQEAGKNFIGIEVHPPGVGRLINQAGLGGLPNLKVYMADAVDVLEDCIPDGSIHRFQLYFPDPWHKVKHRKRRIVQPPFLNLILRKLQPGGIAHFATDWEDYARHMLRELGAIDGLENCNVDGGYSVKPDYRPDTKFEKRGENLGHQVWDLLFQKPQNQ